jgi:hypothetical protein
VRIPAARCEDLAVAYSLTFFCRSGQENGSTALASFLAKPTETGDRMLIRRPAADYADQVDACELATGNGSGMPAAGCREARTAQQMWGDGEAEAKYHIRVNCYLCGKRLRAGRRGVGEQTPECRREHRRPPER